MSKRKYSDGHSPREEKKREWMDKGGLGGPSEDQYNASSLVKMMVTDMQPLSMIEGGGFQAFVKKLNPDHRIPKTISSLRFDLLQLYESVKRDVKRSLRSANDVVLTSEVWRRGIESYQTIGCHFINHDWELKSYVLNTIKLTASNTDDEKSNQLQTVAEEWGIAKKIHTVVMNGPSILPASLGWAYFPCLAHNLDRVFNSALKNDPADDELLKKCRKAVTYLHHAETTAKVNESLPPCQSKLLGEPGWNSTFYMLEKISMRQKAINDMLLHCGQFSLFLNDSDLSKINNIVFALQHFAEAVKDEPHQNYISASRMIPLITLIEKQLTKLAENGNYVAKRLEDAFSARFSEFENNYRLTTSMILDPRFKDFRLTPPLSPDEDKKKRLVEEMLNLGRAKQTKGTTPVHQDDHTGGLWDEFDKERECKEELRAYETKKQIPRNENPLSWWRRYRKDFPNLQRVARKYLGIVSTCVPTVQASSKSGEVYRLQRLRLEPENLNMMLFLNNNYLQKI